MSDQQVLEAILNGQMPAPVMLGALKSFRKKEDSGIEDHVSCVGMKYQSYHGFLKVKRNGTAIVMVPDPANPHDPNAIACYVTMPLDEDLEDNYTWIRAGYIPKNSTYIFEDRSVIYEGKIQRKNSDYWTITADLIRVI